MDRTLLEKKSVAELREIAGTLGLTGIQRLKKAQLIDAITGAGADAPSGAQEPAAAGEADGAEAGDRASSEAGRDGGSSDDGRPRGDQRGGRRGDEARGEDDDTEVREGVLDLLPEGYGFLRCTGYLSGSRDVYVSQSYVRRFDLRRGDLVAGPIRRNRNSDKFPALARVEEVEREAFDPRNARDARGRFDRLEPRMPQATLSLEDGPEAPATARLIQLIAPLGRGSRGLVIGPSGSGRTSVVGTLAASIDRAAADTDVMVLLTDARPEEAAELTRTLDAEVVSTSFDRAPEDHTQVAELVIERAKRLVERGRDVVVLIDTLTRLVRAYDQVVAPSGRTSAGDVDAAALLPVRRLLAAARDIEGEGSLTIVATLTDDPGSATDRAIVDDLLPTATWLLRLDGALAAERRFPALDLSGTRVHHEEQLMEHEQHAVVTEARRQLAGLPASDAHERLSERLAATDDRAALVADLQVRALT